MASVLRNVCLRGQRWLLNTKRTFATKRNIQCQCNQYSRRTSKYYQHYQSSHFHTSQTYAKIVPFKLSDIGEGIREVSVKEWFVKVGDTVRQFDNICEVQSDKASVTITSRYDGQIMKLHHEIDSIALVGDPLVDIDVEDDEQSMKHKRKTDTKIFSRIGIVGPPDDEKTSDNEDSDSDSSDDEVMFKKKALATPAVRRIAMQNKLDLSTIPATGKGGRVLKEDILRFLNISSDELNILDKTIMEKPKLPFSKPILEKEKFDIKTIDQDKTVPVSGFTKIMAKTMTAALKIPHFMYSDEVDVTQLVLLRNDTKNAAAEAGIKLTYMPFFIKAASQALKQFPIINSTADENCENVTYKAAHNIGVAMDTPNGLAVPNIKNIQNKNILEIASELNRLQQDGSKGVFKPDDIMGGTFSLSNIGIIGGTYTKPVILSPQVSIGAIGKIQILPRFNKEGNVIKAHIMCVSWTADHRIIDGVTMAKFSNKWKFYVENPNHLMLEL